MTEPISRDDVALLALCSSGDEHALNELMQKYRSRLKRLVRLRLNPLLRTRVDDSDVIQDAFLEASKRIEEFAKSPEVPFFLWIRKIVAHKLVNIHRVHLDAECRTVNRELSMQSPVPVANSTCIAEQLLVRSESPSGAAQRAEQRRILEEILNSMEENDREVLALRHFEQLSNVEIASVLGIQITTASKRYVRALTRLRDHLAERDDCSLSDFIDEQNS